MATNFEQTIMMHRETRYRLDGGRAIALVDQGYGKPWELTYR
jgi:hypothetical protein